MSKSMKALGVVVVGSSLMLGLATAHAQNAPLKVTLFGQPSVNNDAIWMAIRKRVLSTGRPGRHISAVPVRHDRVSGIPDRSGRHCHDRRSSERAVFLPG